MGELQSWASARRWLDVNSSAHTTLFLATLLFSAGSFLAYATSCLVSTRMKSEFARYGFERSRALIGGLQLLGSAGLLLGLWVPFLGVLGAGGLAAQMLAAVAVRWRIGDSAVQTVPALAYLLVNAWLCVQFLGLGAG